jgi:hypothetical protein
MKKLRITMTQKITILILSEAKKAVWDNMRRPLPAQQ